MMAAFFIDIYTSFYSMLFGSLLQPGGEEGKNINFWGKEKVFPSFPANLQSTTHKRKNLFTYLKSPPGLHYTVMDLLQEQHLRVCHMYSPVGAAIMASIWHWTLF
jgi:hypothetical protein